MVDIENEKRYNVYGNFKDNFKNNFKEDMRTKGKVYRYVKHHTEK